MKNAKYNITKLLDLKVDATEEEIKIKYHRALIGLHPDISKSDTQNQYIKLRAAYKNFEDAKDTSKYEFSRDLNYYLECTLNQIVGNKMSCKCGDFYKIENCEDNEIECESCSLRIKIIDYS